MSDKSIDQSLACSTIKEIVDDGEIDLIRVREWESLGDVRADAHDLRAMALRIASKSNEIRMLSSAMNTRWGQPGQACKRP